MAVACQFEHLCQSREKHGRRLMRGVADGSFLVVEDTLDGPTVMCEISGAIDQHAASTLLASGGMEQLQPLQHGGQHERRRAAIVAADLLTPSAVSILPTVEQFHE